MKLALIACLLAVSVISSEAYWGKLCPLCAIKLLNLHAKHVCCFI